MARLILLLTRLFSCRHRFTYRERRDLYGLQIMHLVCDCGHAVPAVQRSEAEYRQIACSQGQPLKATKFAPPSAAERARICAYVVPKNVAGLEKRRVQW